jgi:CRISPR/Cas system CSM-associated protein Csm3 (group 7 of RAMP superfamily)
MIPGSNLSGKLRTECNHLVAKYHEGSLSMEGHIEEDIARPLEGTRAPGRIGLPNTLPPISMQDHNKQQTDDRKQGHYASKRCGESMRERPGNKSHAMNDVRHEGLMITKIDPPGQVQVQRASTGGSQASNGSDRTGTKDDPS